MWWKTPAELNSLSQLNSVELRCLTGKPLRVPSCVNVVVVSLCHSQKRETLGNLNHPEIRDSACVYIISDSIKPVSGSGANLASVGSKVKILLIWRRVWYRDENYTGWRKIGETHFLLIWKNFVLNIVSTSAIFVWQLVGKRAGTKRELGGVFPHVSISRSARCKSLARVCPHSVLIIELYGSSSRPSVSTVR